MSWIDYIFIPIILFPIFSHVFNRKLPKAQKLDALKSFMYTFARIVLFFICLLEFHTYQRSILGQQKKTTLIIWVSIWNLLMNKAPCKTSIFWRLRHNNNQQEGHCILFIYNHTPLKGERRALRILRIPIAHLTS